MIVSPIEAAKNTVLMKDSNYVDIIKLISSPKAVNIINSLPKAVFFKWPLKSIKTVQKTAGRLAKGVFTCMEEGQPCW